MLPVYQSFTTTGAMSPIALDRTKAPFSVAVAVYLTATATYGIQFTLDDLNGTNPVRWFNDANLPPGSAASGVTNYAFPVSAIRLNITANSGTVEFKVIQGYAMG